MIIFLTLLACTSTPQINDSDQRTSAVSSALLNTEAGYSVNTFTGEDTQVIINSLGDTIVTGQPIMIEPEVIDLDTIPSPTIVSAGAPEVYPANQNITQLPSDLTSLPIDLAELETSPLNTPESANTIIQSIHEDHFIINAVGDTIATGVPLKMKGTIVQPSSPQISAAAPFGMRDNAIFDIQYLSTAQGLQDPYVYTITQDQDGNFWFTTNLGGLTRYDGERFTTYNRNEGLSGNMAGDIVWDDQGHLWIATSDGGLSVFDGVQFTHFNVNNGFITDSISSLYKDRDGNIWIGTSLGVTLFNGETFTHYTENEGLNGTRVSAIFEDRDGSMWFGMINSGVNIFDGKQFAYLTIDNGLPDTGVLSIEQDKNGDMWLGTWSGAAKINGSSITVYSGREGLTDSMIFDIYEDKQGNIWFATLFDGLVKFEGDKFHRYSESEGLNMNGVNTIFEDQNGILWLGMNGGGIIRFNQNSFKHFVQTGELDHRSPLALLEDQAGNYWFSAIEGGITRYNGNSFDLFTSDQGLSGNSVWSLLEDSKGNIWIGTNGDGVNKYDGQTFTHYTLQNNLPFHTIENMIEDDSGNIWFGIWNGVAKFDGENFYNYSMDGGLSANQVWSLFKDSDGTLWFGTYSGGVIKYDGETFTAYTEREGLSGNNVFSITEDNHGNMWFGTDGNGLNKFDGKKFEYYTTSDGLANNVIRSLFTDHIGNIWAGTDRGLSRISIHENDTEEIITITNFGIQSGLKGVDFSFTSGLLDSKNQAWWGNGQSLAMLDLNNLAISQQPPKVHLSGVDVNGNPAIEAFSEDIESIEPFYQYLTILENEYFQNHLTFHVAAIDWEAPHKILYSYKLEGLDNSWSSPTQNSQIDYRNLSYGDYVFQVKSMGESRVWSEPVQYAFTILPPWWHSWWAYAVYSFLFLSLLAGLDRYRHRFERKRQQRLEEMIQLRTEQLQHEKQLTEQQAKKLQELDAEKNRFFTNISHEFRTPLMLTIAPLENLKAKKYGTLPPKGEQQVNMAIRNSKRLMRLVSQLLDLAKFEANLFKLKPEPAKLNDYVKYIADRFIGAAERKQISYNIEIPDGKIFAEIDSEQFEKVISNLLSNAFKFTPKNGAISLSLHSNNGQAIIKIKDSGIGISKSHLNRLFDRFYQVEKSELQPGSGIGLALVKEITELHGGSVEVKSDVDKGTEFTVYIPLVSSDIDSKNIIDQPADFEFDPEQELIEPADDGDTLKEAPDDEERKTILVIDDNRDIRAYLNEQFSDEFNVLEAESGNEALTRIETHLPDVIISDVMMPDGDGFSLLKELRANPETSFLPVILLTAKAEAEDKLEGLGIGADDYLTKPFSMAEVQARVSNLIQRQKRLQTHFAQHSNGAASKKRNLHPDSIEVESADDKYLEKIRMVVQERMHDENFSVEELANLMFQSRTQLFRRMKDLEDETPSAFIKRMRVERGAELLVQNSGTVSEIAYSTGFKSVAQFSKSFREYFSKTPTSYAKNRAKTTS
jgi:signal transduction histidine kinase/ligand-binding sensor domain-containing protein/DNA-binding response OmpR family regulator